MDNALTPKDIFTIVGTVVSLVIAVTALSVSLWDRRRRLVLRARKGKWLHLKPTLHHKEVIFMGMIEIYNASSRTNAIRDYRFWCRRKDEEWQPMESEHYTNSTVGTDEAEVCNETPLTLASYSGTQARVQALTKGPQPYHMEVRIEVEDLFGKTYRVEVKVES
jgi:hypothetical protein